MGRGILWLVLVLGIWGVHPVAAVPADSVHVKVPRVVLSQVPISVAVQSALPDTVLILQVDGRQIPVSIHQGTGKVEVTFSSSGKHQILVQTREGKSVFRAEHNVLPGWLSLLPALMAIFMALFTRQVIPSLFLGIWAGAWITYGLSFSGLWKGLLEVVDTYVLHALNDTGRLSIIVFSLMIGGMVGIISRNGGMKGIVRRIVRWARSPKRGQLATSILGVLIFFDDYANTLVVGNTMRPVTDSLKISREKLAYIVDSTAAPVAALALVTTWIGYEVSLIGDALARIGVQESAYSVFLHAIPYSFYPILAVFFVFLVAGTCRDFGPMYLAEVRARKYGQVYRPGAAVAEASEAPELRPIEGKPHRALNAFIPVAVMIVATMVGLYVTGEGETLREIIGSADSYKAMLWGSLLGVLVAGILSVAQRILTMGQVVLAWYAGLKAMLLAIIILTLAWALSDVNEVLHTAGYLISILSESLNPAWLPAIIFVLSAASAFATGSSWGVMGIMMPLVLPLAWAVLGANQLTDTGMHIFYATVSSVLAGAVWGDHCSPISDTTILSSMASGCDHIDHVRTQLPYALTVGFVGLFIGLVPVGYGISWWLSLVISALALFAILKVFGKSIPDTLQEERNF